MSERSWKTAERRLARDVGNEREPVTGERGGRDFGKLGAFAYQSKVRRSLPTWLFDWLGGIVTTAKRHNQIGVLVLNRPRSPRRNALVVLRWSDWCELHTRRLTPGDVGTGRHQEDPREKRHCIDTV